MSARLNRTAWFLALGLSSLLFAGAVPLRHAQLAALAPAAVPLGWTSAGWQAALADLGLVPAFYASYVLTFEIVLAVTLAIAATLTARRGTERTSLLAAVSLLLGGLALLPVLAALPPSLHELVRALRAAAWLAVLALLLLFPNGRFQSAWARWLLAAWAVYQLAAMAVPALAPPLNLRAVNTPAAWGVVGWHAAALAAGLALQYRRFTQAAHPEQRQQSQWLLFAALWVAAGSLLLLLPQWLLPLERAPGLLGAVITLLTPPAHALLLLAWPVAVALAATRTGQWDVDFLVNRALVYGPLLAGLAALSAALLFVLEQLVPGESIITFAVTAVLAGLLFQPLRHRLQNWVDRRLYHIHIDYRARPSQSEPPTLKNHQLNGYTRLQYVSATEFGHAYRALPPAATRPVTLHVLPPPLSADPAFAGHFKAEMAAAVRLEHPNLARIYAAGETDGLLFAASEYLVGQDLRSFLLINGRLALARAQPILADLARALDYLHAQGQVHGDVRLANVMLVLREPEQMQRDARFPSRVAFLPSSAFRTVLLHVGLARALNSGRRGSALPYTAPEHIRAAPVDSRADIYSLGALAYQMLAGMLPFPQPSPGALVVAHLRQAPPDPRGRVPSLSPAIAEALVRAIAKDPEARFATAGEFIQALG